MLAAEKETLFQTTRLTYDTLPADVVIPSSAACTCPYSDYLLSSKCEASSIPYGNEFESDVKEKAPQFLTL